MADGSGEKFSPKKLAGLELDLRKATRILSALTDKGLQLWTKMLIYLQKKFTLTAWKRKPKFQFILFEDISGGGALPVTDGEVLQKSLLTGSGIFVVNVYPVLEFSFILQSAENSRVLPFIFRTQ